MLLVRRPDDDESLPGVWGLPAASLAEGESEQDAVRRAGLEKLGVEVRPLAALGEELTMTDWRVEIVAGEPSVPQAGAEHPVRGAALGRARRARAGRAGGLALLARAAPRPRSGLGAVSPHRRDCSRADRGGRSRWRPSGATTPTRCRPSVERLADGAVAGLRERGSPAHDGLATRLVEVGCGRRPAAARAPAGALGAPPAGRRLRQPHRPCAWCARPTAAGSPAGEPHGCRAWANRWALGAGGAVDLGESPAETLTRELQEEWQLEPEALSVEALLASAGRDEHAGRARHGRRPLRARCRTPSTTSGPGGPPTSTAGPPRRTSGSS